MWTLFDKVQSLVLKEHQATPGTASGELPIGLDPSLAWLVESTDTEPAFDPNAERLEPSETIAIDPADTRTGTRVFGWEKVGLSAEALDQKKADAILKREKANVQAIAQRLRDGETITNEQTYSLLII